MGALMTEDERGAWTPVGAMSFGDDGPDWLQVDYQYSSFGPLADVWLIGLTLWTHPDLVDRDNRAQWDPETDQQIPETCFGMTLEQARELAAMITNAADAVELFQNGLDDE